MEPHPFRAIAIVGMKNLVSYNVPDKTSLETKLIFKTSAFIIIVPVVPWNVVHFSRALFSEKWIIN